MSNSSCSTNFFLLTKSSCFTKFSCSTNNFCSSSALPSETAVLAASKSASLSPLTAALAPSTLRGPLLGALFTASSALCKLPSLVALATSCLATNNSCFSKFS